ncbi:MAG: NADH-dependent alcohol dehydrogenase [Deltaproteobacteria bacterium HGW-Deltaproteobacteria-1]|jgi:NADP-dependent alcohol dehydrogenase|nr:MAG: NADH-dependent alcohol dehydrogenase [Deltaproteobacteria bacterium HGW-Deltaproteobacteria-1]
MLNFTFHNPTKVFFGQDTIRQITGEIPKDYRVMITFGGGSARQNGALDEVQTALQGYDVTLFGGIEPNPEYETLIKGVMIAREKKINYLLAVGGGSVIDGTKFMAAAIPFSGAPFLLLENKGSDIHRALPVGAVVTLSASGSEMNNRAIISRRNLMVKRAVMNPFLFPRFAVLDPTKTYTMPARQIGNGVVDTFAHVLEQYMTYPVGGAVQDRLAEGLLHVLIEEGPKALTDPENYDVRSNLMWAATLGLNGLIGAGVPQDWAAHRFGYELTVLYGLDHARTLSVLVPAMLQVRARGKRQKLLQYAARIWGITSGSKEERIEGAINKTKMFFEFMGLPTRFNACDMTNVDIDRIIRMLEEHGMVNLGENNDVTLEMMRKILELCL